MDKIFIALIMIVVAGIIGWTTNKLAIKMLFRPVKPVKILFFTFQGLIHKRKDDISSSISETVSKEFLDKNELVDELLNSLDLVVMKQKLKQILTVKITEVIPNMFLIMLRDNIEKIISDFIDKEGDNIFNEIIATLKNNELNIDIAKMIKTKIDQLDFMEFEKIILSIADKELKHIEFIGLILGLLIGFVQATIFLVN